MNRQTPPPGSNADFMNDMQQAYKGTRKKRADDPFKNVYKKPRKPAQSGAKKRAATGRKTPAKGKA